MCDEYITAIINGRKYEFVNYEEYLEYSESIDEDPKPSTLIDNRPTLKSRCLYKNIHNYNLEIFYVLRRYGEGDFYACKFPHGRRRYGVSNTPGLCPNTLCFSTPEAADLYCRHSSIYWELVEKRIV